MNGTTPQKPATPISGVIKWARQPSTLMAVGLLLGAVVYWFTKNAALAVAAAAIPTGAVSDNTKTLLEKIEGLETTVANMTAPKP